MYMWKLPKAEEATKAPCYINITENRVQKTACAKKKISDKVRNPRKTVYYLFPIFVPFWLLVNVARIPHEYYIIRGRNQNSPFVSQRI